MRGFRLFTGKKLTSRQGSSFPPKRTGIQRLVRKADTKPSTDQRAAGVVFSFSFGGVLSSCPQAALGAPRAGTEKSRAAISGNSTTTPQKLRKRHGGIEYRELDEAIEVYDIGRRIDSPLLQGKVSKARYYRHALSEIDKQALAMGVKLKNGARESLARYHTSTERPVSQYGIIDTVIPDHVEVVKQKQSTLLPLWEPIRHHSTALTFPVAAYLPVGSGLPPLPDDFKSSYDYGTWPSPVCTRSSTSATLVEDPTPVRRSAYARSTSYSKYPRRKYVRSLQQPLPTSPEASGVLVRVKAEEVTFTADPAVTFDLFLAPHVSGKGEAYKDAANAKKNGKGKLDPGGDGTDLDKGKKRSGLLRRFYKLVGIPNSP